MENKKVVVLVKSGLPFKKTIQYGYELARDKGAKLELVGVGCSMDQTRMMAVALCEVSPYDTIARQMDVDTAQYLEQAVQFCLDKGITVQSRVEEGGLDLVMRKTSEEKDTKLVVVPTPTHHDHYHEFINAIKQFTHEVFDVGARCPIVTVVST